MVWPTLGSRTAEEQNHLNMAVHSLNGHHTLLSAHTGDDDDENQMYHVMFYFIHIVHNKYPRKLF